MVGMCTWISLSFLIRKIRKNNLSCMVILFSKHSFCLHSAAINSFNFYSSLKRQIPFWSPFHRWRNWGTERVNIFFKVIQLVISWIEIQTQTLQLRVWVCNDDSMLQMQWNNICKASVQFLTHSRSLGVSSSPIFSINTFWNSHGMQNDANLSAGLLAFLTCPSLCDSNISVLFGGTQKYVNILLPD